MKKTLTTIILFASLLILPAQVTLEWDPVPSTNAHGYTLKWGATSNSYTNSVRVTNETRVTIPLGVGKYYATASTWSFNTNIVESQNSPEIFFEVLEMPKKLRIRVNVQSSAQLGPQADWQDGPQLVVFESIWDKQRFYRASIEAGN